MTRQERKEAARMAREVKQAKAQLRHASIERRHGGSSGPAPKRQRRQYLYGGRG